LYSESKIKWIKPKDYVYGQQSRECRYLEFILSWSQWDSHGFPSDEYILC
jgi:hypothetical protein